MKIGDLVRPVNSTHILPQYTLDESMCGIITGFTGKDVIVFWNEDYPSEWEYPEQLEVISESE